MLQRNVITRIYALLIALYPARFKAMFADEMLDVFDCCLADADTNSEKWLILAAELRDWPKAMLIAYCQTIGSVGQGDAQLPWLSATFIYQRLLACLPLVFWLLGPLLAAYFGFPSWPIWVAALLINLTFIVIGLNSGTPPWLGGFFVVLLLPIASAIVALLLPGLQSMHLALSGYLAILLLFAVLLSLVSLLNWSFAFSLKRFAWCYQPQHFMQMLAFHLVAALILFPVNSHLPSLHYLLDLALTGFLAIALFVCQWSRFSSAGLFLSLLLVMLAKSIFWLQLGWQLQTVWFVQQVLAVSFVLVLPLMLAKKASVAAQ